MLSVSKILSERFNKFVTEGRDHDFHRGELAWRLANQSGKVAGENQSLGMIEEAPFFGLELHPSAAGSAGLLTNTYAQVLETLAVIRLSDYTQRVIPRPAQSLGLVIRRG